MTVFSLEHKFHDRNFVCFVYWCITSDWNSAWFSVGWWMTGRVIWQNCNSDQLMSDSKAFILLLKNFFWCVVSVQCGAWVLNIKQLCGLLQVWISMWPLSWVSQSPQRVPLWPFPVNVSTCLSYWTGSYRHALVLRILELHMSGIIQSFVSAFFSLAQCFWSLSMLSHASVACRLCMPQFVCPSC